MRNPTGFCDRCGSAVTPGSGLCSRCGNLVTSEAPGDAAATALGSPPARRRPCGPGPPVNRGNFLGGQRSSPDQPVYSLRPAQGLGHQQPVPVPHPDRHCGVRPQLARFHRHVAVGGRGQRRTIGAAYPGDAGVFLEPVSHGIQPSVPRGPGWSASAGAGVGAIAWLWF